MIMNNPKNISDEKDRTKAYLSYLDKEMTFCGLITTFSLACALLLVDKMFPKAEVLPALDFKSPYFISALFLFLFSAFLLFRQRANLAYNYGQISLELADSGFTNKSLDQWLRNGDAWQFWYYYLFAIALILCAFSEIIILLFLTFYISNNSPIWLFLTNYSILISLGIITLISIAEYFYIQYLIRRDSKMELPHYKVYTRISVSSVHKGGVGIVAIADIPKDEFIFHPDNDDLVWLEEKTLDGLPENIKKLYDDFCVKKGDLVGCPVNFNKLTPAWYLNNSTKPNVYSDENLRFKALRDIKNGEELTADYSKYSDPA